MNDEQPTNAEPDEGTLVSTSQSAPPVNGTSAIVLRGDQKEFDHKQLSTLALISPGLAEAPRGHLAMFFHYCVRTGLDPFARQIYMIGRTNWKAAENPDEPEKTWTIQTGIDGFRTIAHRAAARSGEAISYEDTIYYDSDGQAHDVWLSKTPPSAVKVTVLRGAARFPFVARWDEFAPTYYDAKQGAYVVAKMWRKMGSHMLRKCAEAGGLRMAAPHDLSGLYVDEEMEQADADAVAGVAEEASRRLRAAAGIEGSETDTEGARPAEKKAPAKKRVQPSKRAQARAKPKPTSGQSAPESAAEDEPAPHRKRTAGKKTTSAADPAASRNAR
ncbi:recombinase RecT [Streptomyces sp. NPDC095613]|uniref:recombinase RecT n=1 Tax=Streptomyces sp. NPDC095613 TaxID=3155540 RepID=UPI0033219008